MKNYLLILAMFYLLIACKENKQEETLYASYGKKITTEDTFSKEKMAKKFSSLKEGDTIDVKFSSNINEVCKKKGCWMKLDLGKNKETMVRFKDYGFFVPLDADNKEVVVQGKAYVTKISVDQLKHYAKDAGKSEEEIALIIEPKTTYAFEANGVLLKE